MFRTTLRNLLSHKLRLAFSGLAVVLGVAFVSGTLVFTGTLGKTFRHLLATVSADVTVTKKIAFGDEFSTESGVAGNALPASTLDRIRDIPGVDVAEGVVQSEGVYVLDRKGKPYGTGGAPGIGVSASLEKRLSPVTFEKGRNPRTAGEVALDDRTADKTGYRVGDRVRVLTPSAPVSAELVGVFRFGEGGSAGASITAFDPATAQRLLLRPGLYSSIEMLADDGVSQKELKQRVAAELGTGRQINELLMMMAALLVLSIVIAVLGIVNTLALSVIERTREIGLLRAVGMGRRQLRRMIRLESVMISVYGAVLGVALGAVFGLALTHSLRTQGIEETAVPAGRIAVFLLLAGVVGVLAALWPARRAARLDVLRAVTTE